LNDLQISGFCLACLTQIDWINAKIHFKQLTDIILNTVLSMFL